MLLKPKGLFKISIQKLKTKDRNKTCLKYAYKDYIKIRNPQKKAKIRGPKNLQ